MKIGHAPKTVDLENGEYLHFWYANNKGRGDNNCTIIRSTESRAAVSAKQTGIIKTVLTSSWAGNVNFSQAVQRWLGIETMKIKAKHNHDSFGAFFDTTVEDNCPRCQQLKNSLALS